MTTLSFFRVPEFSSQSWVLTAGSCECSPWEAVVEVQTVEFLSYSWGIQIEFLDMTSVKLVQKKKNIHWIEVGMDVCL